MADKPAAAAGLFTQNLVRAASVDYSHEVVKSGALRAVLVNSGNANCCTGAQGANDVRESARLLAKALEIEPSEVAVASTGVIGKPLDMEKFAKGITAAPGALGDDPHPFMEAILTTDLVEKKAQVQIGGGSIFGVAKGSGMIAPNMATMLAFIVTDLEVDAADLQRALAQANEQSFSRLTIDGDTSTNDMLIALASGASGEKPDLAAFQEGMTEVCSSLAKQIARDGEGATKLIEVRVTGSADPKRIARTIAESLLVKSAMFGCDPNWGRILAAAGRAGVDFEPEKAELRLICGDQCFLLCAGGATTGFDPKPVSAALKREDVIIDCRLGEGETATVYTCDLGYGYIRINAEYHT